MVLSVLFFTIMREMVLAPTDSFLSVIFVQISIQLCKSFEPGLQTPFGLVGLHGVVGVRGLVG